jgi:hypothetical protein
MKLKQTTQIGGSAATDMIVKTSLPSIKVRLVPTENACVVLLSISIQSVFVLFCVTASGLVRLPLELAVHHPLLTDRVVARPQQGFCCVRVVRLLQTLARVFMPDRAVLLTETTLVLVKKYI